MLGSLKMNTALEYSTRVVQEGDRRCKKSTLNDLAYLTPLRIPLMNPVTETPWRGHWTATHTQKPKHRNPNTETQTQKPRAMDSTGIHLV
jgi:hypothetical protein